MCGIFGFVSAAGTSAELVVDGLRRLEYRGYDSWGVATLGRDKPLTVVKRIGKISRTGEEDLRMLRGASSACIGHTRWATHGEPTQVNAHPHFSSSGRLAVVHNGIIENYRELRSLLEAEGYVFRSQTDTEVIGHLLERELGRTDGDFHEALTRTLLELRGAFGLAILDEQQPDRLFAVRMGSPLVIGVADGMKLISSDANALVAYTKDVIYLDDGEWAEISSESVATFDFHRAATSKIAQQLQLELASTELGRFQHYMRKEIYDQPDAVADALRGRLLRSDATIQLSGLQGLGERGNPQRVKILACGSSWHAALIGKQYLEELAGLPTEVEYASEFRYRHSIIEPRTLVIAVSQSGETADTLAGLKESRRRGAMVLGIVNGVGSSIARECGRGVYLHAGPEFGVAATKSFTNQVAVFLMLAIHFGRKRGMALRKGLELIAALEELPELMARTLERDDQIREIAEQFVEAENCLYVGRALEFPIALEGALKLKEVAYIHAEGMPAAELKHGPIALITREMPVVVAATQSFILDKIGSNLQEIRARGGRIIAVISEENTAFRQMADYAITVPTAHDMVSPLLANIPNQLLAYHLAVLRGCDVDQPRNLAKSVTVE
ncbi:MAG: glutamine--fructose-6-phosphate transaminase (isomerizing) [Planctomycetia bacterium]